MRKKFEIKLLRSIKTGKGLIKLISNLRIARRKEKNKKQETFSINQKAKRDNIGKNRFPLSYLRH